MQRGEQINRVIRQLVREKRKAQRYSQEMLAEGSDLHTTTISRIETGTQSPKVENIYQICQFLEIRIDDFFAEVQERLDQ